MKVLFLRLICFGIIAFIVFINLRNFHSYFGGERKNHKHFLTDEKPKQETKETFTQIPPPSPSCIPIKKEPLNPEKKYKAILRFDSIDGNTPLAVLKKIVIDTERYHTPLVLSIIPEKIDEYPELKKFLKNESCNVELAAHGWDNFSAQSTTGNTRFLSEFSEISYSDALERIKNAKEKLNDLTHEPIITLVPPFNLISEAGIQAAKNSGIHVISRIGSGTFDAFGDEQTKENLLPFSKNQSTLNCIEAYKKSNLCVISLRIENFLPRNATILDPNLFREYLGLLEDFSKNGVEFTTFRELQKSWPDFSQYSLIN